ncbi:TolC family protein [Caulobacter segnis]|uniref:Outer membrane efflux protein n=2 Tax=Caulobacter segnis TaxID=88688 RepID=D5VKE3_CAUST|nr:TolC family protein [Caulobacter segnis]ADG10966.1 outer membrane efflux protein [Caulobacter segnis ATCC 21756]AVQ02659.1 TolC family protein [Caulobacter segnis]
MSSNRWPLRAALASATCGVLYGAAQAQTAPPLESLLRDASAPRLSVGEAETHAAEGRAHQARAWPNPVLDLQVENVGGDGPYRDFQSAETTLSLGQTLELGGKRGARVAAALAELDTARSRASQNRVTFARDLFVAYATAEAAGERLVLAKDGVELAQADARAARLLVDNGKEAELRVLQAQAAVSAAQAEQSRAEAEADAALARLSALIGGEQTYAAVTPGVLDRAWTVSAATAQPPAVAVAQAEQIATARKLDLERRRAAPDVTISFGIRRLAGDDATAAVAGVSLPLPLFDRNRGAVKAAQAEADAARARLLIAQADATADRRGAEGEARAAERSAAAAREGEAAAREAYRLAKLGYEAGKLPLLELLSTRRDLVAARQRHIETRLARAKACADLAQANGQIAFGGAQ